MRTDLKRTMMAFNLRLIIFLILLITYLPGQDLPLTISGKANPHGGDNCLVCHTNDGKPSKANYIKGVCSTCHNRAAVDAKIHILAKVDTTIDGAVVPADYPLNDGSLDCLTCHTVACKTDRSNQNFLRGGPYKSELDFCYQCHPKKDYVRVNPHKQIKANGEIDKSTCLHCHIKVPTPEDHPTISNAMHMDMRATCNKCHALHQHESNHQGRDLYHSRKVVAQRFEQTEARYHIKLPLSADKKIQCNTCHDPHQRGVLAKPNVVYENKTGSNDHFLRLSKEKLCYGCHDL